MARTIPDELTSAVMRRMPGAEAARTASVVRATLAVLGERLTSDEARALAGALGEDLGGVVARSTYAGDFDADELYERVRRRERVSPSLAREHVHVVVREVAARMGDAERRRIVRALPEELAVLFEPPPGHAPLPPYGDAQHAPVVHSLATGRPGSTTPLSESRPFEGHAQSVARSDDPHGATKLSSARGTTQERHDATLASGKPPAPDRSVAEADDDPFRST